MSNLVFSESLDAKLIKAVIEPENQTYLQQLTILKEVDSTNTYLLNQTSSLLSGTVCFAEKQTAGRGRQGRSWFSPDKKNIYCSLFWCFKDETRVYSSLSIATAVMIARALKKWGISSGIELKWPNDILFKGRKLAGILLEAKKTRQVVIGFGLNLFLPPDKHEKWIALEEISDRALQRNYLAGLLLNELLRGLSHYEKYGFDSFWSDWIQYDVLNGRVINIYTSKKIFSGIMRGINQKGELLLEDEEGNELNFCYGEVSVRLS